MHSSKINAEGFICAQCRIEKKIPKPENKFTAKSKKKEAYIYIYLLWESFNKPKHTESALNIMPKIIPTRVRRLRVRLRKSYAKREP
jgi:hypothetical protein